MFMIYFDGIQKQKWFWSNPISIRKRTPYWINHYIYGWRTNYILAEFHYTENLLTVPIDIKKKFRSLFDNGTWTWHPPSYAIGFMIGRVDGGVDEQVNLYSLDGGST